MVRSSIRKPMIFYLVADILGHKDVNTTRKHYAAMEINEDEWQLGKIQLKEK